MKKIALVAVAGLALATAACSKPAEEASTEADAMAVAEEPMAEATAEATPAAEEPMAEATPAE